MEFGAFGENIVVSGYDLKNVPVGSVFQSGEVRLEITQIGKNCHSHCAIHHKMGDCIMPREGIFARVLSGGTISAGDEIHLVSGLAESPLRAAVITLSDKGAKGERADQSGPLIRELLEQEQYVVEEMLLLPDDRRMLETELARLADQRQIDLVLTTGGTGFSPRDITPEATIAVCDRMAPGIAEAIRMKSLQITDRAMLSRAASGIRKRTLIVNLPGSPKAVRESMDVIMPALKHGIGILRGTDGECGSIQ